MLKFIRPEEDEREHLLSLTRDIISGTEAYTALCINNTVPESTFFCGYDEKELKSLVYNNGDEDIRVFGSEFSPLFTFNEKILMIYAGFELPVSDVRSLRGKELIDFYKLLSGGKMSFDDERRYVLRLKGINAGLSEVFGIYENNELISVSAVSAMNEKYGLIGDVFTHPLFRCRGYSKRVLDASVSFILSRGKIPYLRCEEKMYEHYKKAGFTYYGKL